MIRLVMKSKVSQDGILHLAAPVGLNEADREVQITVESVPTEKAMLQAEWSSWVDSMAGA